MDLKQIEVLMRSFPFQFAGIFGLIFNIFILYDNLSLIFSIFCLILGVIIFTLGLVGKFQIKNYGSARLIIICIVTSSIGGIIYLILVYLSIISIYLIIGILVCAMSGYCVGLFFIQKRVEKGENPNHIY